MAVPSIRRSPAVIQIAGPGKVIRIPMTRTETNWPLGATSGAMLKNRRQARGASEMTSFRFAAVAIMLAASATLLPGRIQAQMGGDGPHVNILADGPSK